MDADREGGANEEAEAGGEDKDEEEKTNKAIMERRYGMRGTK
jgi:hypothetical protein